MIDESCGQCSACPRATSDGSSRALSNMNRVSFMTSQSPGASRMVIPHYDHPYGQPNVLVPALQDHAGIVWVQSRCVAPVKRGFCSVRPGAATRALIRGGRKSASPSAELSKQPSHVCDGNHNVLRVPATQGPSVAPDATEQGLSAQVVPVVSKFAS